MKKPEYVSQVSVFFSSGNEEATYTDCHLLRKKKEIIIYAKNGWEVHIPMFAIETLAIKK